MHNFRANHQGTIYDLTSLRTKFFIELLHDPECWGTEMLSEDKWLNYVVTSQHLPEKNVQDFFDPLLDFNPNIFSSSILQIASCLT